MPIHRDLAKGMARDAKPSFNPPSTMRFSANIISSIVFLGVGLLVTALAHPIPNAPQVILQPGSPTYDEAMENRRRFEQASDAVADQFIKEDDLRQQREQNLNLAQEEARQQDANNQGASPGGFWGKMGKLTEKTRYRFGHLGERVKDRGQTIKEKFRSGEHDEVRSRRTVRDAEIDD
ncbi:hypothetical protein BJ684DRAFT_20281 [Piptocephalis cylindrospora]|uniref:Uncharacterized protein n=1 Tax=Piptocephalis cylindrospora TaxID=1907219 RepID=A0A4P9Y2S7_9FUNG|nr:hypothetical protein BJ684DRAFT_20281 [Piptocephalis cylindrospora]|eukprot:RKP13208.1 hypothetical protein BJ684DRAFT_20281 [Piptocephalis cylindrospora]